MKYLITGGAGSLGRALVRRLTSEGSDEHEIVVYSRDEGKHAKHYASNQRVKCYIGDVRDIERLDFVFAVEKPDYVIHAAALKRIDDAENNPTECWKTNVVGSENVCRVAIKHETRRCILISTDKACLPANVYGASKFTAERIFSHYASCATKTKFASARYGNVIASRGSFIPSWREMLRGGKRITITHPECSRYLFTLNDAVGFILNCLYYNSGFGEVFVPYLKPYNIVDVLNCLVAMEGIERFEVEDVGIRPGEKLHEDMLAITELPNSYSFKFGDDSEAVCIVPSQSKYRYKNLYKGSPMNTSLNISKDMDELTELIKRGLSETN